MKQPLWYNDDLRPVDYPSDQDILSHAFDLFFQERAMPRPFGDYRRRAETELLEQAFRRMNMRACRRRDFRGNR